MVVLVARLGLDSYSPRRNPGADRAAGYTFAMRYLSHTAAKDLGDTERKALHASGLGVGVVWETTAHRAAEGSQAGRDDAVEGRDRMNALGFPPRAALYLAVDFDATPDQVRPYFTAADAYADPIGVYAGHDVVDDLISRGICRYGWQSMSTGWHGSHTVTALGHIHQTRYNPGRACDENMALKPNMGLWEVPMAIDVVKLSQDDPTIFVVMGAGEAQQFLCRLSPQDYVNLGSPAPRILDPGDSLQHAVTVGARR